MSLLQCFSRVISVVRKPPVHSRWCKKMAYNSTAVSVSNLDPLQVSLLDEPCIVVDENDKAIRTESKKNCHIFVNNQGILHRAFSVFLFNTKGEVLLQQRSMNKITFPGYFSNTCCSHPLYYPEEMEENDALGVKRAAQRRLEIELGIPKEELPLDSIQFVSRLHYSAPSGGPWGEHEITYVLMVRRNVTINKNENEVMDYAYVSKDEMPAFLKNLESRNVRITPWFRLIVENLLPYWWDNLSNIKAITDTKIHKL